ncbi:MAG TPA: helix-turn-helix transcriptional regulator [Pyrinomonadaceae bacterium]|nr:helix-turn-helix transcriptional regulator [Pyrinomonadaceae bacterium]
MAKRPKKPKQLGKKLLHIREAMALSQSEILKRLGFEDSIAYTRISDYELDKRVPPLPVLLEYARIARIHLEDLVDDDLELPGKLPGQVRHKRG